MNQVKKPRVLLVDDEKGLRFTLGCLLKEDGYDVTTAATHDEAMSYVRSNDFDLAFIDIMLGGSNGIDLLRDMRSIAPDIEIIMITGWPKVESAAEAVRLGAFDYITKPIRHETLVSVARHALKSKRMADEREKYRANLDAIFRSVSDGIIMIDRHEHLMQFNSAAGAMCGYDSSMIGREVHALDLGCNETCFTALRQTLHSKNFQEIKRFECKRGDISRVANFTSAPVIGQDGALAGVVAVIRDETRLVNLERSLHLRGRFHGLIGENAAMRKLYSLIEALADVQTTVLINGESGTGKELVASALHHGGNRKTQPFVKLNCSALSEHLLETELFGHVRGAFTGAIATKTGRFQEADGGTIFLDEIGDITPAMQMRLLRVLQERVIERVGDSTPISIDVRVIAATNQDLAEKVRQGTFRQDLYYRLNVVRLIVPPLRERMDDLMPLTRHFLEKFNNKFGKKIQAFSDDVVQAFLRHDWPGNVRELEHAIEHCCIMCLTDIITMENLPPDLMETVTLSDTLPKMPSDQGLKPDLTLEDALAMTDGNKSKAARLLGISRRTVYRHLQD